MVPAWGQNIFAGFRAALNRLFFYLLVLFLDSCVCLHVMSARIMVIFVFVTDRNTRALIRRGKSRPSFFFFFLRGAELIGLHLNIIIIIFFGLSRVEE